MNAPSPATDREKPIRCLIIQLTRLGDTLQSLMALRAAKQLYPNLEIHFVARERFAEAAKRVPWISKVIVFPTKELIGPHLSGAETEREAISAIAKWVEPLIGPESWDLVVNWSYSEASSYLTALVPAKVKLGYTRRKTLEFACAEGWSQYIQGIVQEAIPQNIHLTDLFTTQLLTALQIHLGESTTDGNAPVTSKTFFSLKLSEAQANLGKRCWADLSKKWIAIQLGAGERAKTWEPENWAITAGYILRRHPDTGIALLGGADDENRARRFLAKLQLEYPNASNVISFVGQTDFDLWASIVSRCHWLLSGDTAAIHLASVLGTRVLNVSVGPVRWAETGPYGNGHYVICSNLPCPACESDQETQTHTCRMEVKPEAVYGTWAYASSEWSHRRKSPLDEHFSRLGWSEQLERVRIYRSKIRNTSDGGGVVFEPMIHRPLLLNNWVSMVIGHVARSWYCGWVPPIGQELSREMIGPALVQKLRELDEAVRVGLKIYEEAAQTAEALNSKSSKLRSDRLMQLEEKNEIQELGKKLLELDGLMERLGHAQAAIRPFPQMAKVMMHNLRSTQLADLGRESAQCYRQLKEGLTIVLDWLNHTLQLAKPVAITSEKSRNLKLIDLPPGIDPT